MSRHDHSHAPSHVPVLVLRFPYSFRGKETAGSLACSMVVSVHYSSPFIMLYDHARNFEKWLICFILR